MEFITYEELSDWIKKNDLGSFDQEFKKTLYLKQSFPVPKDSGKKTHISQYLLPESEFDEGIFFVSDTVVWPSADNQYLINSYLKSLGDTRRQEEGPCFRFGYSDIDKIKCLFSIVLYLYYDALIVLKYKDKYIAVDISHDEFIDVFSNDAEKMQEISEYMKHIRQ